MIHAKEAIPQRAHAENVAAMVWTLYCPNQRDTHAVSERETDRRGLWGTGPSFKMRFGISYQEKPLNRPTWRQ